MNTNQYQRKRKELLDQIAGIERMRKGRLSEEYRERVVDGQVRRSGPYFKHQQWKNGKNVSKRVKGEKAERLKEGISGMDRFKRLCEDYAETTVAMTEHLEDQSNSKKNCT